MEKQKYLITEYGAVSGGKELNTKSIQLTIDTAYNEGGGVVVVPKGVYLSGALFFKQGVDLCVEEGAVLKGSDDISDYPILKTRIEGETCDYFCALINADNCDRFCIYGGGVIDGNGQKSWSAFWKRREWNPKCTNKDEQRPRLVYISNSDGVSITNVTLQNSHFWTCHLYKCKNTLISKCNIFSPSQPIKAPSTDGVDIDVCENVVISDCFIDVNDDAVALKGGKGIDAQNLPDNGKNQNVLIENCKFGANCHSLLTFGSETIENKNVTFKNSVAMGAARMVQFKMRSDTVQLNQDVVIDGIKGNFRYYFLDLNCWKQFAKENKKDLSKIANVTIKNCEVECLKAFNVGKDDDLYFVENFSIKNVNLKCNESGIDKNCENFDLENVKIV